MEEAGKRVRSEGKGNQELTGKGKKQVRVRERRGEAGKGRRGKRGDRRVKGRPGGGK